MEQMIRRIIRAAVESFPINRTKKAEILQRLTKENLHGGEHHEPRSVWKNHSRGK